jgi:endonuclease/exonuclease/phosphatase family metal-dependent hydrolase
VVLVALTLTLALQSIRALFPLLFAFGEDTDFVLAGAVAVGVFAAPILAGPVDRLLGRNAVAVGLGALIASRVALQLVHPIPLWLAITATVAALVAITVELIVLRRADPDGARTFAIGLVLGFAVDTAVRAVFLTWDLPWRQGFDAFVATLILAAGAAVAARPWIERAGERHLRLPPEKGRLLVAHAGVLSTALIGPFLMLDVLFLQSPAFAASAAEFSLEGATALLLAADAVALLAAPWLADRSAPAATGLAAGVLLAGITWALTHVTGWVVAVLIGGGQALAVAVLIVAVDRTTTDRPPAAWKTYSGVALGGVAFMLLAVAYQIHYEVPLPVSNQWLPVVAAMLLGLAGLGRRMPEPMPDDIPIVARLTRADDRVAARSPGSGVLAMVPLVLLLVPLAVLLARPDRPVVEGNGQRFRLVNYNVHLAVNPDGQLDPVATAETIEALRPDVLVLQEAGRGWPVNGTMDVAEWMSRRLDMPFVYQPAADGQFGNAVLSRLPILSHQGGFLPFGAGPQRRSYLRVEIDAGGGRTITVFAVHLQHQEGKTATREGQIRRLLEVWAGAPATVITGDMNTQPDEANLRLILDAGLLSVQDEAGLGNRPTATEPTVLGDRVDYLFVTEDLSFTDVAVPFSGASDHLPIAATILVG